MMAETTTRAPAQAASAPSKEDTRGVRAVAGAWKYLLAGIFFGILLTQSQAVSWYRIQEMFLFHSFHMYGIIGSALAVGVVTTRLIRRYGLRDFDGNPIVLQDKAPGWKRYLFGGTLFGLGWSLAGACPGPMFVLIGHAYLPMAVVLASAILGTFVYGLVRHKLPH